MAEAQERWERRGTLAYKSESRQAAAAADQVSCSSGLGGAKQASGQELYRRAETSAGESNKAQPKRAKARRGEGDEQPSTSAAFASANRCAIKPFNTLLPCTALLTILDLIAVNYIYYYHCPYSCLQSPDRARPLPKSSNECVPASYNSSSQRGQALQVNNTYI